MTKFTRIHHPQNTSCVSGDEYFSDQISPLQLEYILNPEVPLGFRCGGTTTQNGSKFSSRFLLDQQEASPLGQLQPVIYSPLT